jgi:hypothetical protein
VNYQYVHWNYCKNFWPKLDQISKLNEAKLNLDPFPDSEKGLKKLNEAIRTTGTGEEVAVADIAGSFYSTKQWRGWQIG